MKNRPLLLGHRGVRDQRKISENTLAAFDFALAQGCDGFEFDVRLSKDGEAVVCHDETAGRLRVASRSVQQLHLPLLRQVLSRYQGSAFLDIELKVPGLERLTADLLHKLWPKRGFVVSSFLPPVLKEFHRLDASIPLGLICETPAQLAQWKELPVEYVIPQCGLVRQDMILQIKAVGKKILVWTVNLPAEMKRFAEWGVDGIISDSPEQLVATLVRRGKVQR
jgi:glycerophosphoryl diester phosphodiesterase